jgi:hypothetical protein
MAHLIHTRKRLSYTGGQVLGADDLRSEQDYLRGRLQFHNRAVFGFGVLFGLDVSVDGGTVTVSPGTGITPGGEEVMLESGQCLSLPARGRERLVVLSWEEVPTELTPSLEGGECVSVPLRVEERLTLDLASAPPGPSGLVLARIIRGRAGWGLDTELLVPRARCPCG